MTLGDLKKAVKDFKSQAPKLTSRKSDLLAFAARVGLMKKKEEVVASEPIEPPVEKPKKVKVSEKKPEVLPEVLKKVVEKKVAKSEPAKSVKSKPSFAQFMSENKGKGLSMSQMAEAYKKQKA